MRTKRKGSKEKRKFKEELRKLVCKECGCLLCKCVPEKEEE